MHGEGRYSWQVEELVALSLLSMRKEISMEAHLREHLPQTLMSLAVARGGTMWLSPQERWDQISWTGNCGFKSGICLGAWLLFSTSRTLRHTEQWEPGRTHAAQNQVAPRGLGWCRRDTGWISRVGNSSSRGEICKKRRKDKLTLKGEEKQLRALLVTLETGYGMAWRVLQFFRVKQQM